MRLANFSFILLCSRLLPISSFQSQIISDDSRIVRYDEACTSLLSIFDTDSHSTSILKTRRLLLAASRSQNHAVEQTRNLEEQEEGNEYDRTYQVNLELSKLANEVVKNRNKAADKGSMALELFETLRQPDTVAYNSLLKVLAKVSPLAIDGVHAAHRANEVFQKMKQTHEEQYTANQQWYQEIDQQLEKQRHPPRIFVKPNVRTYATVMDAHARRGTVEGAQACEEMLSELQQKFERTQDFALQPNLITYNTVLAAWSKVGGSLASTNCQRLLENMPIEPDRISYNAYLHAIAKSGWKDAGHQAEAVLRHQMDNPGKRSYTTVIDAWSRSGQPDQAHKLLQELVAEYKATGNPDLQPNAVSYSTVIHAYAVSKDPEKADKAYRIFESMVQDEVTPNRITFNNLLNCCASCRPSEQVMQMVKDLYRQVDRPDYVTFGTVLKACSNLITSGHDSEGAFAQRVFQEAAASGLVTSGVLWQFRQAVPIEVYRSVVGDEATRWHDLPNQWTCNVRKEEHGRSSY